MTETEWMNCEWPSDMLRHLDRKISDEAFMRFSVACCRRIWPLITDARSRAVIDATDGYLNRSVTSEAAASILTEWELAYRRGEVEDLVGGCTNDAIDSVAGLGDGNAMKVAWACSESVGYAASSPLRSTAAPEAEAVAAWRTAELKERVAQCSLIRELFGYISQSDDR